jgi:hypothetical protein
MNSFMEAVVTIATAICGVAIVAVLVSKNAQTPAVIQSAASGFGNSLDVAISPVTGNTTAPNLSYPGGGLFASSVSSLAAPLAGMAMAGG